MKILTFFILKNHSNQGGAVGGAGCTLVLPVIGTVACGTAGAVAGGVFGGMVGAATFC